MLGTFAQDVLEELLQAEILDETDKFVDNLQQHPVEALLQFQHLPPNLRKFLTRTIHKAGAPGLPKPGSTSNYAATKDAVVASAGGPESTSEALAAAARRLGALPPAPPAQRPLTNGVADLAAKGLGGATLGSSNAPAGTLAGRRPLSAPALPALAEINSITSSSELGAQLLPPPPPQLPPTNANQSKTNQSKP